MNDENKKLDDETAVLRIARDGVTIGALRFIDDVWVFDGMGNPMEEVAQLFFNAVTEKVALHSTEAKANAFNAGLAKAIETIQKTNTLGMTDTMARKTLIENIRDWEL